MRKLSSVISLLLLVTQGGAVCPTPTVPFAWTYGTGVSYSFPTSGAPPCWTANSISDLGIDGDIEAAFNQWTYADQSQNGSNIGFYYSTPGTPFQVYARRL